MKRTILAALLIGLAAQMATKAQTQPASQQKSLAATMNVYVFPAQGQAAGQQSKDESECYDWAVKNTGTDPFELTKQAQAAQQQQAQAAQSAQGSGARGAAKGAAARRAHRRDRGRRRQGRRVRRGHGSRRRAASAEAGGGAAQQQSQNIQAATAEQMGNFKKAFSACLEAKKYTVKY